MTKFAAFSTHLGISLLIFFIVLYFILFHWYPLPYFSTDGGWEGIRIMFFVDVVLGPFLTLLVFKQGKPGLKLDMSMIAIAQMTALIWGGWTVYDQRTALVVLVDDAFYTRSPAQVAEAGLNPAALKKFSTTIPAMAIIRLPEDENTRHRFIVNQGRQIVLLGDRYEPLTPKNMETVLSRSASLEKLEMYVKNATEILREFAKIKGGKLDDYAFIPLHSRYKHGLLAIRREDGKIIGMPDITLPIVY